MKLLTRILVVFSLVIASFSCKQDGNVTGNAGQAEKNKLRIYVEKNIIAIAGSSIIGKTQDDVDFGTKEEFWYGAFITDRTVSLSSYCIGKYEVTWGLWNTVRNGALSLGYKIGDGQSGSSSAEDLVDQPVTTVTWYDCVIWCNALTELVYGSTSECVYVVEGKVAKDSLDQTLCEKIVFDKSKKGFRLPTEAEWELACRLEKEKTDYTTNYGTEEKPIYLLNGSHLSGAKASFSNVDECNRVAWNKNNSAEGSEWVTRPVGRLDANGIGAFDMSGNVCEWCYDYHGKIEKGTTENPIGATNGKLKITKGGYMKAAPLYCISSYRCFLFQKPTFKNDDLGFRIACYK